MPRFPVPPLSLDREAVLVALGSDAQAGLSSVEAARRLEAHGANVLPQAPRPGAWQVLGRQFKDVMVLVLLIAIGLSFALGQHVEAAAIAVIAAFTVGLGFVQEWRAERAMDALRRLSAPRATVVRDGVATSLDSADVVPGDILVLSQGDIVPADARLLESVGLQVGEASLTGESEPVGKHHDARMDATQALGDRAGIVHASTTVTYGRGRGVVTATGSESELGRIGKLLAGVKPEPTPLQRQLARFARWLLFAGAASVAALVALGLLRGEPLGPMVLFGIAVAVAVVPEALPAVVTISLAIGAQRMARRNALVRRLPTVEALGSTTTICSDKTGTLTTGQMAITSVHTPSGEFTVESAGYAPQGAILPEPGNTLTELARACALCNDASLRKEGGAWIVQGDPTEGALLVLAAKVGIPGDAASRWPRTGEVPFSSERKRMTTVHRIEGVQVAYSKGAPEAILGACSRQSGPEGATPLTEASRKAWRQSADAAAARGLRVLALARKAGAHGSVEADLEFLGLVGMQDAPRPAARQAIDVCRTAGIRPVLITGDHPLTATAVARELGILTDGTVLAGRDLEEASDAELGRMVSGIQVYARVSPAHKLRIVDALQAQGEVVAMTGDGVNDAPALRKADVGVAMGITGTDAAKQASGMILADDNFATIVGAVEEGRGIYDNIRKYLMFLLSTNLGELLLLALTMLAGLPLPITAVQILYVNLASDGLPALALAVDPHEEGIMRRPPRRPGGGILSRPVVGFMVLAGLVSALSNLGVFLWARSVGKPIEEARTMVFVSLVVIQLLKAYTFRSLDRSILTRAFSNKWLNRAVIWELGLLAALVYVPFFESAFGTRPMPLVDWLVVLAAAFSVVAVLEAAKRMMRRALRASSAATPVP